jgi:hypothetical protein
MSDEIKVKDLVDAILNPAPKDLGRKPIEEQENKVWGEFTLKQEVLPEGSAIVDEQITEISIIDLKGKNFKFPGSFTMVRDGGKITFKAT